VATNPDATMEELLEAVFSAWSMPSGYEWDKFRTESVVRKVGSCVGVNEEKMQLKNTQLEAVTREWLVKTQQTETT
jgi:hypothetical protein